MPRVLWHHWYTATVRCAGHTFVNPRNRFLFLRVWLLVDAVCSCNPSFNSFVSVFKQGELCRSDLFGRTRLTIASLPADQAQSTTPSPASYIAPDSSSQFRNRDVTLLSGCTNDSNLRLALLRNLHLSCGIRRKVDLRCGRAPTAVKDSSFHFLYCNVATSRVATLGVFYVLIVFTFSFPAARYL